MPDNFTHRSRASRSFLKLRSSSTSVVSIFGDLHKKSSVQHKREETLWVGDPYLAVGVIVKSLSLGHLLFLFCRHVIDVFVSEAGSVLLVLCTVSRMEEGEMTAPGLPPQGWET